MSPSIFCEEPEANVQTSVAIEFEVLKPWKISSLRSARSGREWLWKNPVLAEQAARYAQPYGAMHDTGGWDEILPTVSECAITLAGRVLNLPDHGDLVTLPWRVQSGTGALLHRAWVSLRSMPITFTREILRQGEGLVFIYTVENTGSDRLPFLWCPHPLLCAEPGMVITLRGEDGELVHRVEVPDPSGHGFCPSAEKWFSRAGEVAEIDVQTPDEDEILTFRYNPADAPHVGLWLNFCGWHGAGNEPYFNFAVEPTTAPCDTLSEALELGSARWLAPGESRLWTLFLSS